MFQELFSGPDADMLGGLKMELNKLEKILTTSGIIVGGVSIIAGIKKIKNGRGTAIQETYSI